VSSRTKAKAGDGDGDGELLDAIAGHWNAIENGIHRVRDVSRGEDAGRVANPNATRNMLNLHNLASPLQPTRRSKENQRSVPTILEAPDANPPLSPARHPKKDGKNPASRVRFKSP
jgi:hypothetical protein